MMKKTLIALMMMGLSTGAMADYKKADTILHCKDLKGDKSRQWYLDTKKGWLYNEKGFWMGPLGVDNQSFTFISDSGYNNHMIIFGYTWDRNTGLMSTSQVFFPDSIKYYVDKGEMSVSEKEKWWTMIAPYSDFMSIHFAFRFFNQEITADGPTKGQNISAGEKDHKGFKAIDYHKRFFNAITRWPALKLATDFETIKRNGFYDKSLSECKKINQTLENKF